MFRKILIAFGIAFLLFNVVCFMHAYKFTHFDSRQLERTGDPKKLSTGEKLKTLFFGIDNPRPRHKDVPNKEFKTVYIESDVKIECWKIDVPQSKGTVILFHGYAGEKSSLLERSYYFNQLQYTTLLVDFKGSGGSEGNSTSVGYHESEEVKSCYDYVRDAGEKNIILFGTSMGSAAILKFLHDHHASPQGIILECPFGSFYETTCARFRNMNVPSFPAAGILLFWGGVQNKFWPFEHNPSEYAKQIECPAMILYGSLDDRVSAGEISEISNNLKGEKDIKIYPQLGHNDLFGDEWRTDVTEFVSKYEPK